jgi:hypothetical protein
LRAGNQVWYNKGVKKHLYVSVMGTMGSGKTTAAKLIANRFHFHLIEENFGENVFLPRFYQDMKRWAFHSQTFFLTEKINQTLDTPAILLKHSVVQDTPIQQDVFSYAKAQHVLGNIDDAEWRLYQKIYRSFEPYFSKPDLIVYLETSVSKLTERIDGRGRGYEQKIPQSYLELLDMLNKRWLSENTTIPVMMICTDKLNIVRKKSDQKIVLELIQKRLQI